MSSHLPRVRPGACQRNRHEKRETITMAPNANSLFITGTDTGVGKTYVASHLLQFLISRKLNAGYQKWVATGNLGIPDDLLISLKTGGIILDESMLDSLVPYRFQYPASPHLAAKIENKTVDPAKITQAYRKMAGLYNFLIVEGVGGILVPLTGKLLLADLLTELAIPTLVVARSGLGTLNHTLLTLESLRHRRIPVLGVVCCDSNDNVDEQIIASNMETLAAFGGVTLFGRLMRLEERDKRIQAFAPIGQAILDAWQHR